MDSANPTFPDSNTDFRKKKAFRFKPKHDTILLHVIKQFMPWAAVHGYVREVWASAADTFSQSMREKFTGLEEEFLDEANNNTTNESAMFHVNHIACKRRFDTLIDAFRRGDLESLRASGTDDECREREKLLVDIDRLISVHDEWRRKCRPRKASGGNPTDESFPYLYNMTPSVSPETLLDTNLERKIPEQMLQEGIDTSSDQDRDKDEALMSDHKHPNTCNASQKCSRQSQKDKFSKNESKADPILPPPIQITDRQLVDEIIFLKRRKLELEERHFEFKKREHSNLIASMQSQTAAIQAQTAALLSIIQHLKKPDTCPV